MAKSRLLNCTCVILLSIVAALTASAARCQTLPSPGTTLSLDGNSVIQVYQTQTVPSSEIGDDYFAAPLVQFNSDHSQQWTYSPATSSAGIIFRPIQVFLRSDIAYGARSVIARVNGQLYSYWGPQLQVFFQDNIQGDHGINFLQLVQSDFSAPNSCAGDSPVNMQNYFVDHFCSSAAHPQLTVPFYTPLSVNGQGYLTNNDPNNHADYAQQKDRDFSAKQAYFYDLPSHTAIKPQEYPSSFLNWQASLFPVAIHGNNVTVYDGITWGYNITSALNSETSGAFFDPDDRCAVVECTNVGSGQLQYGGFYLLPNGEFSTNFIAFGANVVNPETNCDFVAGTITLTGNGQPVSPDLGQISLQLTVSPLSQLPSGVDVSGLTFSAVMNVVDDGATHCINFPTSDGGEGPKVCVGQGSATKDVVGRITFEKNAYHLTFRGLTKSKELSTTCKSS